MRVCITGATGLIGTSLLARLSSREDLEITALARSIPPQTPIAEKSAREIHWLRGDLGSPSDCRKLVDRQDVVIHLAHTNSPLTSDQDIASDALLNLVPTLHLLAAIQDAGTKPQLIYASSGGAIYGASETNRKFQESDTCAPNNSYGIQKLAAEHYMRLYASRGYLSASVLRIANAYGWLLPPDRQQGLVGTALFQVLSGQPIRILGNPQNVRDYVHIDDICAAIEKCLSRRNGFEIFNIGTGIGTSVADVVGLVEKLSNSSVGRTTESTAGARFLPGWCVLDVEKARRELGWDHKIDLETGIRMLLEESMSRRSRIGES